MSKTLNPNVEKFFELCENDPELRKRIDKAEADYPGCLEIRDAVVENVLIPIAEELGLGFSLSDLRKYETKVKMQRFNDEDPDLNAPPLWLLDRGGEDDASIFEDEKEDEK